MPKKPYFKLSMKILLFFKGIVHKSTQYVAERLSAWQKPTHLNFSVFKIKRSKCKKNVTTKPNNKRNCPPIHPVSGREIVSLVVFTFNKLSVFLNLKRPKK